ncbi:hypothetical protein L0222_01140 [bacterium]|nr:hypothetical protein [bacterium]MCI0601444.1 hypothetical protein [bacterium]
MWKKILLGILALLLLAGGAFVYWIGGPSMVIGMIRYDQREEGRLRVGDRAPDVPLLSLDGKNQLQLSSFIGPKPLVLVFGSFT